MIFKRVKQGLALFATALWVTTANAQIVDPRVLQLEEQVRQLTGQIEELNFQLLQMQETLRRQQEDNEFRLQQLEDQKQGALQPTDGAQPSVDVAGDEAAPADGETTIAAEEAPVADTDKQPRLETAIDGSTGNLTVAAPAGNGEVTGLPPRSLGTITMDANGNVTGASVDFSEGAIQRQLDGASGDMITGAVNPEELYQRGYDYALNGDYAMAEKVFAAFVDTYPDDMLTPNATFWLGESILSQGRLEEAAGIFVDMQNRFPQSEKAPETLYKIGYVMASLGNRDVACATFNDALTRYPSMTEGTRSKINLERGRVQC